MGISDMAEMQAKFVQAAGAADSGIKRVAVIGAGAMGSGIAAQFANAGIAVDLLDMAGPEGDRLAVARAGIERQVKSGGFMHPDCANLVSPGTLSDDLDRLSQADWIVEAIIEDIAIKRALYAKLETLRKAGSIVSSNTSTLRREDLVSGQPESFDRDFLITHFFNPPRHMRLVELVGGQATPADHMTKTANANRALLGKDVVTCYDTPGFIANRVGCFWIAAAILEAIRQGVTVETADAVHAAFGIPRTGCFGLLDLIGVDLVQHVWKSLHKSLPQADWLQGYDLTQAPLIQAMIAAGQHGRKTGQGFYRKTKDGAREALDLATGAYRAQQEALALPAGGRDLAALVEDQGPVGHYARAVLVQIVGYASLCGPEIAGDVAAIDRAMELGYSWRDGPFKLADRVGLAVIEGALRDAGCAIPPLLAQAIAKGGFYQNGAALQTDGQGHGPVQAASILSGATIIAQTADMRLRDMGDGVACFEATSKLATFSPSVLDGLEQTIARAGQDFNALVLGNENGRAFSAGADLGVIHGQLAAGNLASVSEYVARGQALFAALEAAPVPVVAAVHGHALGGGCEFQMLADHVMAHAEASLGLPETKVGILPGWGGTSRLLGRIGPERALAMILHGKPSGSARQAIASGLIGAQSDVVMAIDQLLPLAKAKAVQLAKTYAPQPKTLIALASPQHYSTLLQQMRDLQAAGEMSAMDLEIAEAVLQVFAPHPAGALDMEAMSARELTAFNRLAARPEALARMAHMLKTGKPLAK